MLPRHAAAATGATALSISRTLHVPAFCLDGARGNACGTVNGLDRTLAILAGVVRRPFLLSRLVGGPAGTPQLKR